MEEINWNLASNEQLKEELKRLETTYTEKQNEMREVVSKLDELHNELSSLSSEYVKISMIVNKREGKHNGVDK